MTLPSVDVAVAIAVVAVVVVVVDSAVSELLRWPAAGEAAAAARTNCTAGTAGTQAGIARQPRYI